MVRTIIWAEISSNDLEATANYISRDSPTYAAACVRDVRDAARSLVHFAERGRVVPEFSDPNVRELFVRNYRLIYRLDPMTVYIIGFIHGSRDLRQLWDREKRPSSE